MPVLCRYLFYTAQVKLWQGNLLIIIVDTLKWLAIFSFRHELKLSGKHMKCFNKNESKRYEI